MRFTVAILIVAAFVQMLARTAAAQSSPLPKTASTNVTAAVDDQWASLKQRAAAHGEFVAAGMWGLIHGYRSKSRVDAMMDLAKILFEAIEKNDVSHLKSVGGIDGFNQRVLGLMRPEADDAVAGFATRVLTVSCGMQCAPQIVELMKKRDKSWRDEYAYPFATSRGEAAISLGVMGASIHKAEIAALLKSMNEYDRQGANYALAELKATEYADEIASLLSRQAFTFQRDASPIHALIKLGVGMKYKQQIAHLLENDFENDVKDAAAYALAHLRATEYSSAIAKRLANKYRRGAAARALAVMGAVEYAPQIAAILDEDATRDQAAAMLALGILNARNYAPKIATLIKRNDSPLRYDAAISLLLMGLKEYEQEAATILSVNKTGTFVEVGEFSDLVSADVTEINQRVIRALEQIKKSARPN